MWPLVPTTNKEVNWPAPLGLNISITCCIFSDKSRNLCWTSCCILASCLSRKSWIQAQSHQFMSDSCFNSLLFSHFWFLYFLYICRFFASLLQSLLNICKPIVSPRKLGQNLLINICLRRTFMCPTLSLEPHRDDQQIWHFYRIQTQVKNKSNLKCLIKHLGLNLNY